MKVWKQNMADHTDRTDIELPVLEELRVKTKGGEFQISETRDGWLEIRTSYGQLTMRAETSNVLHINRVD